LGRGRSGIFLKKQIDVQVSLKQNIILLYVKKIYKSENTNNKNIH